MILPDPFHKRPGAALAQSIGLGAEESLTFACPACAGKAGRRHVALESASAVEKGSDVRN
jgi:hypothetical protein